MQTEFEAKILEIDVDEIISKLETLWATKKWEKMQKRYVYDFNPAVSGKWVRLRSNWSKTTLAIKEIKNSNIDWTKELEVVVDDFDTTNLILEKLGYIARSYQENKRTSFVLDWVEVEIDSWPLIPTYMEVEGKSAEEVEQTLNKLGYNLDESTSINTDDVYKKYWIDINSIKDLRF